MDLSFLIAASIVSWTVVWSFASHGQRLEQPRYMIFAAYVAVMVHFYAYRDIRVSCAALLCLSGVFAIRT